MNRILESFKLQKASMIVRLKAYELFYNCRTSFLMVKHSTELPNKADYNNFGVIENGHFVFHYSINDVRDC